jgi:Uma2 family endonuclease
MTTAFTRSDYERLPVGFPAQLVGGALVKEPSPTFGHGAFGSVLFRRLVELVGPLRCPLTPVDVLVDDENVYAPDLVVLREPPSFDAQYVGVPLLVVEVLSPATADRDRRAKKAGYLRLGVEEVWIVDPASRSVEVHDRTGVRAARGLEPARSAVLDGFEVVPAALFSLSS